MKAMQKLTRILMCCICTSLIISLGLLSTPARAAEVSSEFDFSAEDSIDAYDNYEKEETTTETGDVISRVCAKIQNQSHILAPVSIVMGPICVTLMKFSGTISLIAIGQPI